MRQCGVSPKQKDKTVEEIKDLVLKSFIVTFVVTVTFAVLAWVSASLFPNQVPFVFHSLNTAEKAVAGKVVDSYNSN